MLAVLAKNTLSPLFAGLFFLVVISFLARFIWFQWVVVPKVVTRWANEEGYKIIEDTEAWIFKRQSFGASNTQVVRRIVIQDSKGNQRAGLLKMGHYWWPGSSVERCPVEVRWDEPSGRRDFDWSE